MPNKKPEIRNIEFSFRLSKSEHEKLQKLANKMHMSSIASYVRYQLLNVKPKVLLPEFPHQKSVQDADQKDSVPEIKDDDNCFADLFDDDKSETLDDDVPIPDPVIASKPEDRKPEPHDDNIIHFPTPTTVEATMDALIWILDQKYRKARAAATGTRVPSWLQELDEDSTLPEYSEYKDPEFLPAFGSRVILRHILPAEEYRRHVERELPKYKYYARLDRYEAQAAIQLGYRVYLNDDDETGRIYFRHQESMIEALDDIFNEVLEIKAEEWRNLRF